MLEHRNVVAAIVLVAAAFSAGAVGAGGNADAGRKQALQCQACHGLDGVARVPGAPHLAGQVEEYLVKAMTDYKSGNRKNEVMSVMMPQVSDQQIADLAAFYASLPPKNQ